MLHLLEHRRRIRSFWEDLAGAGSYARHAAGTHAIPIACIQGSVGRDHELRSDFMPITKPHGDERYRSVLDALRAGKVLPAIEVYRLGSIYYVVDGNHRVAAARRTGMLEIDAEVTDFQPLPDRASVLAIA